MIQLDPEVQLRRERDAKIRVVVTIAAAVCMLASVFLPHITVESAEYYGRSLLRVQFFFLKADPTAEGWGSTDPYLVGAGINAAYLGLAAQEAGLIMSCFSIWALLTEGVGRWVRRIALVAGWLLTISAPLVVTGWRLLNAAGVPTKLGVAYFFALAAGLIMIFGARAAKARLDSTWYWSKPDLIS